MSYQEITAQSANLSLSTLINEPELQDGEPWGFWATLGLSLVIVAADLGAHAGFISLVANWPQNWPFSDGIEQFFGPHVATELCGDLISMATIVCSPVVIGLAILFAWARRTRSPWAYLGLRMPTWRQLWLWGIGIVLLSLSLDAVAFMLGWTQGFEVMVEWHRSTRYPILLFVEVVIFAPLVEEILFRGFILPGLSHSLLGSTGAVLFTSLAWSMMHLQYDPFGMFMVFLGGIYLGVCVLRTGSTLLALILHGIVNLISMLEIAVLAPAQ